MTTYSRITGTGSYLPPRRVTNADLAAELAAHGVETSDDWIVERTGIRERRKAAPGESTSDMAIATTNGTPTDASRTRRRAVLSPASRSWSRWATRVNLGHYGLTELRKVKVSTSHSSPTRVMTRLMLDCSTLTSPAWSVIAWSTTASTSTWVRSTTR